MKLVEIMGAGELNIDQKQQLAEEEEDGAGCKHSPGEPHVPTVGGSLAGVKNFQNFR